MKTISDVAFLFLFKHAQKIIHMQLRTVKNAAVDRQVGERVKNSENFRIVIFVFVRVEARTGM